MDNLFLGSNLKYIRGLANLTILDLSTQLKDTTPSALASYEDRGVKPRLEGLLNILEFYNNKYAAKLTLDALITTDLVKAGFKLPEPVYLDKDENNQTIDIKQLQQENLQLRE